MSMMSPISLYSGDLQVTIPATLQSENRVKNTQ